MNIKISIFLILFFGLSFSTILAQEINTDILEISSSILKSSNSEDKLKKNEQLLQIIKEKLSSSVEKIEDLDSTGLIFEMQSEDKKLQILTWAVLFNDKWEYFGYIKSYNESKKIFSVWELTPVDFLSTIESKKGHGINNWPAGVYYKLINTKYNKRNYYTLLGWLGSNGQTAYKFIEVLTLSKSGKPSFGKQSFFSKDKKYSNRFLFGYNASSNLQLDYGNYNYSEKQWNRKKKQYDIENFNDNLIVFDFLVPMYPDLEAIDEFLVPSGNVIDAFIFEKGKWRMKQDIDARNNKTKKKKERKQPQLNLFPDE